MAYVYRHIRLDKNEPFYIGLGVRDNHRRARTIVRRNQHWKNIVAKTDWEAEILFDDISLEEAKEKEIEFIKLYGRKDKGEGPLVNLTDGGYGTMGNIISDEMKERLSIINTGKKLSQDHINKISKANTGKKHSPEVLLKLSLAKIGRKQTIESINKRRIKLVGNKSTTGQTWSMIDGKKVYQKAG